MVIRIAEEKDIPGILALLQQVGEVHHRLRPDIFRTGAQKYDATALKALFKDAERPIFVAEKEGSVLGYCFCIHKTCENHPIFLDRKELYIDDLCVDEGCRGSGIAAALYRHTREYAKESGCNVITLNVWCGNDRARHFYEKMGMTPRNITMEQPL